MKAHSNFRTFFGRRNVLKTILLNTFVTFASYPRLALAVFLRRGFGERAFNLASAISLVVLLGLFPIIGQQMSRFASHSGEESFLGHYATWYLFLAAFCYAAYKRWREVKTLPSIFELARFTKHDGDIHPFFYGLRLFGKEPTIRQIEIFLEPAGFFAAGLLLAFMGQPLGALLIITSLCYCLGYAGQFMQADELIMDTLDDLLIKDQMYSVIMGNNPGGDTKGVRLDARLPESQKHRKMLFDYLNDQEDDNSSTAV